MPFGISVRYVLMKPEFSLFVCRLLILIFHKTSPFFLSVLHRKKGDEDYLLKNSMSCGKASLASSYPIAYRVRRDFSFARIELNGSGCFGWRINA